MPEIQAEIQRLKKLPRGQYMKEAAKVVNLSQVTVRAAIGPMVDLLVAKRTQFPIAVKAAATFREWAAEMASFPTDKEAEKYNAQDDLARGERAAVALNDALYGRLEEHLPHLKDLPAHEGDRMDRAADYTDEWSMVGEGEHRTGVRVFYVCDRPVGYDRCPTVIVSSRWQRRWEDPLQTKQRWFCTVCGAKYKTTNGVLVQFTQHGRESYARASIPPTHLQMVKCASVQRTHDLAVTPESLLQAIPEAAIADTDVIRPHPDKAGTYIFDRDLFEKIPHMNWHSWLSADLLQTTAAPAAASASAAPAQGPAGPGSLEEEVEV